jgi:hypothetical protein
MYKAILIDVENKEFKSVEVNDLQDIYDNLNCNCFDVAHVAKDVSCYVDDEGLLKNGYIDEDGKRHNLSGFQVGDNSVLMGNGLLVGEPDSEGETTDFEYPISVVEKIVFFVDFDNNEDKPQPHINFSTF